MLTQTEKPCSRCGETKPFDQFYRDSRMRLGRMSACKLCLSPKSPTTTYAHKGCGGTMSYKPSGPDFGWYRCDRCGMQGYVA